MQHVKIETDARGQIVMIEPKRHAALDQRVFRQVGKHYEWAHLADYRENGIRAKFYGWGSVELPTTMTSRKMA